MKDSFEKGKNAITNARKRDITMQFNYTTCEQLERNEKQLQRGRI